MPEPLLIAFIIIGFIITVISLSFGLFNHERDSIHFGLVMAILVIGLMSWLSWAEKPEMQSTILAPKKVDGIIVVIKPENSEIENLTKYFGKDFNIDKFEIKYIRPSSQYSYGIYWQGLETTYKLVPKQESKGK